MRKLNREPETDATSSSTAWVGAGVKRRSLARRTRSPSERRKMLLKMVTTFGRWGLPLIYVIFVAVFMTCGMMSRRPTEGSGNDPRP